MPLLSLDQGQIGQSFTLVTSDQVPIPVRLVPDPSVGPVDASTVTYTPGDPAAWPLPPPGNVGAALDLLASLRGTFQRNALRVPGSGESAAFSLGPFNVTPAKSGVYLAWASVELQIPVAAAAAQAELSLLVDSVAQGQPLGQSYTVGLASVTLSQLALVTLNRTAAHNWELGLATNAAGSPGHVEAEHGKLLLLEL